MRLLLTVLGLVSTAALAARPIAAQTPDGQAIYREQCRTCHGARGVPPARARAQYKDLPANLADSAFLAGRSEDSIVAVLRKGVGRDMKSFTEKLTAEEMRAVARFVRNLAQPARSSP